MNRKKFERHLRDHGCVFRHRGGSHDIWWNVNKIISAPIPRHKDIDADLVKEICKQLGAPVPPWK